MSQTFFRDDLKFGNVKWMYIVIRKVSPVLPNWSVIVNVSVLIKYYTFVFKKKKNAANNALCSPPVVGKRKKEDEGFRKQLALSRPISFLLQKDKWLVFSTKWICSNWGRWKVLVKMHIIIHISVNHWEPGFFFFSFQSFSLICTVFHSNLGTPQRISIPGLLLKQVFPSFFTCCEPPCLQTSAHTYTICSTIKWRKNSIAITRLFNKVFILGKESKSFGTSLIPFSQKQQSLGVMGGFFTHFFTFATCLRNLHQFSAVFRQKKLLLKDGGGGMGWKEIGCLLIKSCHQKPCHQKTKRLQDEQKLYYPQLYHSQVAREAFPRFSGVELCASYSPHPPRVIKHRKHSLLSQVEATVQSQLANQIASNRASLYLLEQTPSSDNGHWPRSSRSWLTGKFDHNH